MAAGESTGGGGYVCRPPATWKSHPVTVMDPWEWCQIASVFDFRPVESTNRWPFEPPVGQYLEEAVMGLRGSTSDAQEMSPESLVPVFVDKLARVVLGVHECARKVCLELFWLCMGVIFGQVKKQVVDELRRRLAPAWHLLSLRVAQDSAGDLRTRDWVLTALPFLLAQAVYRTLCDAFEEDRKMLISKSEPLIDKLSLVAHFEVAGFQIQPATSRKERRRLFQKTVLKTPHLNFREFVKGQKKQEMLQQEVTKAQHLPLAFGGEVTRPGFEESQLEHLMSSHADKTLFERPRSQQAAAAKAAKEKASTTEKPSQSRSGNLLGDSVPLDTFVPTWKMPTHLGVSQYDGLAQVGEELFQRHLSTMNAQLNLATAQLKSTLPMMETLAMEDVDSPPEGSPGGEKKRLVKYTTESPDEPVGSAEPAGSGAGSPTSRDGSEGSKNVDGRRPSEDFMVAEDGTKLQRNGSRWQVVKEAVSFDLMFMRMAKEKKEREAQERRDKTASLLTKIAEPLPEDNRQRELNTTWVSPVLRRLATAESDRSLLQKSSSDSFQIKMVTAPSLAAERPGSAPQRSVPTKSRRSPAENSLEDGTSGGRMGSRSVDRREADTGAHGTRAGSRTLRPGTTQERCSQLDPSSHTAHETAKASKCRPGTFVGFGAQRVQVARGKTSSEKICMEPPEHLDDNTVMTRLVSQADAFKKQTFGEYVREYDILTGLKKNCIDGEKLKNEEKRYLAKMDRLVGGPPRKQLPLKRPQRDP
eukprot:gnl/TRDRNA2_/TRDRNA2_195274_c0_seq1.p1 gnl/TRDRNA2_/TRDRNA2_195274_c0~~gnl/TRDRNA2_/TRDRNA2_195274_c0_seq1.p1  ORF type:complete len:774 (-),score=173.87 gnl/TRDRNA2_/TRDRNA2_195274_c0_seq1:168-2432(-)